jgi:hypothetical protein
VSWLQEEVCQIRLDFEDVEAELIENWLTNRRATSAADIEVSPVAPR